PYPTRRAAGQLLGSGRPRRASVALWGEVGRERKPFEKNALDLSLAPRCPTRRARASGVGGIRPLRSRGWDPGPPPEVRPRRAPSWCAHGRDGVTGRRREEFFALRQGQKKVVEIPGFDQI